MIGFSPPCGRLGAWPPRWAGALLLPALLWLAACRDAKVATYRIPKENDSPAPAAGPAGPVFAKAEADGLEWTAPAGWKAQPASAMRKGTYAIGAEGGPVADLAITAFPGDVGGDLANVNRWRGQLQLPPIAESDLGPALTPLEAGGLKMLVADLTGGPPDSPRRMLGAIVPHAGATWFFKLTGPPALVAAEKSAYLEFLRTVKPAATPAGAPAVSAPAAPPVSDMANAVVTKADGPDLQWTAPAHWQSKPASAMRKATYVVPDENGATAELAVTAFPGSVGGELANVNRWRGQLQLPPIAEADLAGAVSRITVNGLPVVLVDLAGGTGDRPVRLLGAMVPANGANWFFKLTGPAPLVAREKPAFLALVQSLRAP